MNRLFSLPLLPHPARTGIFCRYVDEFSTVAFARTGGANGGGANSVDGDLYDFAENKGARVLDRPSSTPS